MGVYDNINGTYSAAISPEVRKYFDRTLSHDAESNLVHQRDMQKKTLPLKNGKTVQFRKFHPFTPSAVPLKEGVTPEGMTIKVTEKHATVKPYGNFVPYTDELDLTTIDELVKATAMELSRQADETLDVICANAMNGGLNVIYCDTNGATNTSRADIAAGDILTSTYIKKAVRTLEKNKAKRYPDGYYHAIVDPDTKYDLTNDAMWVDIAKYQSAEKVEKYELGKMMGVKFYETTMTKVFKPTQYLYGTTTNIAVNGGAWSVANQAGYATVAKTTIANSGTDNDYEYWCRQMVGQTIRLYDASATAYMNCLIDQAFVDGTNCKVTFRYVDTASDWSYANGDKLYSQAGGASDLEVHSTIVYGQDFAGTVNLGGDGGAIKSILNPPGSAGSEDPLEQRGTIAWKVKGFAATILQDAYGVRIEHAVSG